MKNLLLGASLLMTNIAFAQTYTILNSIDELDVTATAVQFKNVATGEYIVLKNDPRGGGAGALEAGPNREATAWYFYQHAKADNNNVEVKRNGGVERFNWSNYDNNNDQNDFIAWNHAKRLPNTEKPEPPHSWYLEAADAGTFRIRHHHNGEYLELTPKLTLAHLNGTAAKIITRPLDKNNKHQLWVIEVDKKKESHNYTLGKDHQMNTNPSGVWEYGYGTVGGDFTPLNKRVAKATGEYWNGNESWKGIYFNPGKDDMPMGDGFIVKQDMVVMHPGQQTDHLSKVKFTAPVDGTYDVNCKWTAIDKQAKKSWTWVMTNAASMTGTVYDFTPAGYKEVFTKGIEGVGGSTEYKASIKMKAGEVITFEIGNGGDGYSDDALQINLSINKQ